MTFDDCPAGNIEDILDILKKYDMRATFFVIGEFAATFPGATKRIVEEGHTIANHTFDHKIFINLTNDEIIKQIKSTEKVVYDITGRKTTMFRPPTGEILSYQKSLIYAMNYQIVMWSVDSNDYISVENSIELAKTAQPGDIILFHTRSSTKETIEEICKYYIEHNLKSVTIEELAALAEIEKNGVMQLIDLNFMFEQ